MGIDGFFFAPFLLNASTPIYTTCYMYRGQKYSGLNWKKILIPRTTPSIYIKTQSARHFYYAFNKLRLFWIFIPKPTLYCSKFPTFYKMFAWHMSRTISEIFRSGAKKGPLAPHNFFLLDWALHPSSALILGEW